MLTFLVDLVVLCGFLFLILGIRVCFLLHVARHVALYACRAARIRGAADVALRDVLLAANDAGIIDNRCKCLTIGQAVIKVELHADACKCAPLTERLIEQGLYLLLDVVLHLARHIELRKRLDTEGVLILIVGIVEDLSRIVDNRDVLGSQPLDAVRRKVDNALDLLLRQLRMRIQPQHDGCCCRLLLFLIEAILRQHNVNACLLDGLELFDRTRQLALQGLQVVDAVLKFGDTELAVIEDFKALVSARQPLCREVETCLVDIRRRYEDCCTRLVFLYLIGNLRLAQLVCDLACVLGLHIGKQRHHIRLAAIPKTQTKNEDENREC